MKTSRIIGFALVILAVALGVVMYNRGVRQEISTGAIDAITQFRNATFKIGDNLVTLVNGRSEQEIAPGSASKVVTQYFGNEAYGDLNGDGVPDAAFLVTQQSGGSGTFYYVVAALGAGERYVMTNAFLVGDRIAPQSTNIIAGELHVNFAERRPGEPMSTPPSQGATLLLKVTPQGVLEGLMK